jgi:putative Mg2+ transporter-C (MgtC) family protein
VSVLALNLSNAQQFHLYLWVLYALALGASVGFEREFRGHEAGIRTTALVCAGAAIFSQVSESFGDSRVAAGVVQGVGFLGAGLVFQRGTDITGVTTAATIWVMAGVGLLVGEELWLIALLLTATFVLLLELAPLSDWVYTHGTSHRRGRGRLEERGSAERPPPGPD